VIFPQIGEWPVSEARAVDSGITCQPHVR